MKDAEYDHAVLAWCRYYVDTEAFDRSLTVMRNPRTGDAVIHHDPWVRGQSYAFAREARWRLESELGGTGRRAADMAKERVCAWSYDAQCEYLARAEAPR